MAAIDELSKAQYVNLETFRKNGTGVQTPVWVGRDGNELVIFTNGDSYKVKRLRRNFEDPYRGVRCSGRAQGALARRHSAIGGR